MATLILNAGTSSAITVTCQRAGKAPPRLVGERSISFNGRDRNSIRGQAKVIPIVGAYVDSATEALIQAAGYNGRQIPCSGDILGGVQALCTIDNVTSNIVPGTSPSLYEMSFTVNEVSASVVLLKYAPGDTIAGETFTGPAGRTWIDDNAVLQTAGLNVKRDNHHPVAGVQTLLIEGGARKNLCLQSENFGTTWTPTGSPTRVAAAHVASGISLDLLGDDDAVSVAERYSQPILFTGDGTKAVSIFARQGSSTTSNVRLLDLTTSLAKLLTAFAWVGGLPVVTITNGVYLGYEALADGVFRLLFQAPNVVAANNNQIYVSPATDVTFTPTLTGTVYVGGVQCEDSAFPTSYIKTTVATVTLAGESYIVPYTTPPRELTAYHDSYREVGITSGTNFDSFRIGGASGTNYFLARIDGSTNKSTAQYGDGTAHTATSATVVTAGLRVEQRALLQGDGGVVGGVSVSGGAEDIASGVAPGSLVSAWANAQVSLSGSSAQPGFFALRSFKIVAGVRTLAEMRVA